MSSMFLTHEEVCDLTGARTKAGQIETLKRNGIRHAVKRNGWPSVTTAAIIQTQPAAQDQPGWKPRKTG
ncbi:MAG: hypothetical protein COA41_11135 [Sphingopyxis sp.]|nr:MAG: hypothetical protein COA41_11135 [Sphingopyxis sp.]